MRVAQVSTADVGGGAERVAADLHSGYRALGWDAQLWVGRLQRGGPGIRAMSGEVRPQSTVRARPKIHAAARNPARAYDRLRGAEHFGYPWTSNLLEAARRLNAVQLHNLHGDYFDLRMLPGLSRRTSVTLTMHDAWLTTGHCAQSIDCDRWQVGCGSCPDLTIYPSVRRDRTARNFAVKQEIFSRAKVFVTAPSRWLLDRIEASLIRPAIQDARVIPNGVDTSLFTPGDRRGARTRLGISPDALVVLTSATELSQNPFKDFRTLTRALSELPVFDARIEVLALGAEGANTDYGSVRVHMTGRIDDPGDVAELYRAADVFVHAARADTFPTTVLEAMAAGLPVVASDVGGIPEQVVDARTGLLVPPARPKQLAQALTTLLSDDELRRQFGSEGRRRALSEFTLEHEIRGHAAWIEGTVTDPLGAC